MLTLNLTDISISNVGDTNLSQIKLLCDIGSDF